MALIDGIASLPVRGPLTLPANQMISNCLYKLVNLSNTDLYE